MDASYTVLTCQHRRSTQSFIPSYYNQVTIQPNVKRRHSFPLCSWQVWSLWLITQGEGVAVGPSYRPYTCTRQILTDRSLHCKRVKCNMYLLNGVILFRRRSRCWMSLLCSCLTLKHVDQIQGLKRRSCACFTANSIVVSCLMFVWNLVINTLFYEFLRMCWSYFESKEKTLSPPKTDVGKCLTAV